MTSTSFTMKPFVAQKELFLSISDCQPKERVALFAGALQLSTTAMQYSQHSGTILKIAMDCVLIPFRHQGDVPVRNSG
jgi:hypothetical protein